MPRRPDGIAPVHGSSPYFTPQQAPQPAAHAGHDSQPAAQAAQPKGHSDALAAFDSATQQATPASQHAAPPSLQQSAVRAALAEQHVPQSMAQLGQPSQPAAHAAHGTAQHDVGAALAWAVPDVLATNQPVRPTIVNVRANSDLVADMIQSPFVDGMQLRPPSTDGEPAQLMDQRRNWAR
jgi:hypothetical protein